MDPPKAAKATTAAKNEFIFGRACGRHQGTSAATGRDLSQVRPSLGEVPSLNPEDFRSGLGLVVRFQLLEDELEQLLGFRLVVISDESARAPTAGNIRLKVMHLHVARHIFLGCCQYQVNGNVGSYIKDCCRDLLHGE
ncbi:uncharacterized protein PV07_09806 [Cladophialophora immunda]|uniref:Uncharacterized protein n=1 Tax=Cladophialophora immunda TaxID=569365 RepID=A0A0D1Z8W1_9EURO|nr:uncharacterized protein PV07_09806 [Cladophialophora immunda]KIW24071.1 hypothetical protein PV07_09806 [Cladophialophora immunda]